MLTIRTALGAALMLCAATAAHAQHLVLHVDDDAPPGGDGLTWQTAYASLQDALTAAYAADSAEVRVAQGVYRPDGADHDSNLLLASSATDC